MRCAITGAEGFIGRALIPELVRRGHAVKGWSRSGGFDLGCSSGFDLKGTVDGLQPPANWIENLRNTDAVIHLAGLAHQPGGAKSRSQRYFQINRDGTLRLATAAKTAGVRRFIFVSTAKVFGEGGKEVYSHNSIPAPQDAYAQSKRDAELGLLALANDSSFEVVIIRPPLVYGAEARANFALLLSLAQLPLPLPFARTTNRRSMIGIDNLTDFIAHCLDCPAAANGIWECADNNVYSLADVISAARRARNRPSWQFGLPQRLLEAIAKPVLGEAAIARLFGNFEIDISHTERALGWAAPFGMVEILRKGESAS